MVGEGVVTQITAAREKPSHTRPRGYAEWRPHRNTQELLEAVNGVLETYREHLPMTVRQVFYQLIASIDYPKTANSYARLCEHLVRARRAGLIQFEHLRDDGLSVMQSQQYEGVADFWDAVVASGRSYRRNLQQDQPAYIELWCEAAGMMPQLAKVARKYSVPVYSAGGFLSVTGTKQVADRALEREVPTVLLHVGDLDPSGDAIFTALSEDVAAFVEHDRWSPSISVIAERVALTADQVVAYSLPTAPPKKSDSRSAGWAGHDTCQCEALPPDILARLIETAIKSLMRDDLLERHLRAEQIERDDLVGRLLTAGGQS